MHSRRADRLDSRSEEIRNLCKSLSLKRNATKML